VLVADDIAVNQLVARRLLEHRGCRVDIASDGREALDRHAAAQYDVIFMDCQMPALDGYQATAEIRRREGSGRHTPIIAMTAHTLKGDRERCLHAGMDDYLAKPLDPVRLDQVLARALGSIDRACAADAVQRAEVDSGPAVLDQGVLDVVCDGDPDGRMEIVTTFLGHADAAVATLCGALAANDLPTVRATAHSLTGSAATLGADRLAALTRRICDAVAAGQPIDAASDQDALERVYAMTRAALAPPSRNERQR
jgi:CheY-like chemotaxis protein/HPt (histidine-containing phosphotransfer) domain-containing protein